MTQVNFKQKRHRLTSLRVFLMLIAVFGLSLTMQAQVTIGTMKEPVGGSLLQLKEKDTNDDANAYKGLGLPRVTLSKKGELFPMFLNDPDDSNSGPNADYAANKTDLDKSHIGLFVYNVAEEEEEDLSPGVYRWSGEEWISSDNKMGSAKFDPVDCSDIKVNGVYIEGIPTSSENYLSITLKVIKEGAFTIVATTENGDGNGNGYNFYLSGIALEKGEILTVNVPCQGSPKVIGFDKLIFTGGIEVVPGCEPKIEVVTAVAEYSINCSSIVVEGDYLKGAALTSANKIVFNVTVSKAGSYNITTQLTNGIRFSRSGNLSVGTQSVVLIGEGTPTVNEDFPITINTNSPVGHITCHTTIPMTLPAMTFAVIGDGIWSWDAPARKIALTNLSSTGAIRIASLTQLWSTDSQSTATDYLNNGFSGGQQPDIVVYFAFGTSPNKSLSLALANYINKGGCLIYGSRDEDYTNTNIILQEVFGSNYANAIRHSGGGSDHVYHIANLPDDPIINGPFGNLSSRHWGEDNANSGTVIVTALPPNSVQICSAANQYGLSKTDPEYSVVWYNDSKNFVYFGDSTGASRSNTDDDAFPAIYSSSGIPLSKRYGNSSSIQYVYNSALELNSVVWALKKAAISGINPH